MVKKSKTEQNEWLALWAKQSQLFQEITNEKLKMFFEQNYHLHPEEHLGPIQDWLNTLKNQWQFIPYNEQLKAISQHSALMTKMMIDVSQLLIERWMAVSKTDKPINDIHDLYELWLSCCHDVYAVAMHTKPFQDAYGEWMNATITFWKSMLKK